MANKDSGCGPVVPKHLQVAYIEASGKAPKSTLYAEPQQIKEWDRLSDSNHPDSLDSQITKLKARTDLTLAGKIDRLGELLTRPACKPSSVTGLDQKNLRLYGWQSGDLFSHAAALMVDPETTVEVGYNGPDRLLRSYRNAARDSFLGPLPAIPEEMNRDQVEAVMLWRTMKGKTRASDSAALADDLIDIYSMSLREALLMRERLISDYGVGSRRVRLVYEDTYRRNSALLERAHLFALDRIRAKPDEAHHRMVEALKGSGEQRAIRMNRSRAVAQRLYAVHETEPVTRATTRRGYALLWVRDSRTQPNGGSWMDTRPQFLRQTIELIKANHPHRQIVLVGDDLFARRSELRAAWERAGVLDEVDTESLVQFWRADRNGGRALGFGEQALFFDQLNTERDVIQVGIESGALEMPALLGVPTVYFGALEHDGNKGFRWLLHHAEWVYGTPVPAREEQSRSLFYASGGPLAWQARSSLPPPQATVRRVLFGPDLPDASNRNGWAVAIHEFAVVSLTADRINRLVASGELDHWPQQIGFSAGPEGKLSWNRGSWERSQYYADQLDRWLRSEATKPTLACHKWKAIQRAFAGIREPHDGTATQEYLEVYHSNQMSPDKERSAKIRQAYEADQEDRPWAIVSAVKELVGGPDFRRQAVNDLLLFQLEPEAMRDLSVAMDSALEARDILDQVGP